VRRQLLELAREHGRVCRDGIRIDLPLTHDLISDMVGCARETVTRAFDELQREGFVVRRGGAYQLLVRAEELYA
jgi:CRP-like cAMP-binding protein